VLQIGGSARLSTYGRRVFQHGFHGAHADELAAPSETPTAEDADAAGATGIPARSPGAPARGSGVVEWSGASGVRSDSRPGWPPR
jgi:hypothetical protein